MINNSQKEYIHRINKVTDYIDINIDQDLNLKTLSKIAYFSPFHFHRIFSLITGETLNNYIKRIRLEKSALYLINQEGLPISDVAIKCGFTSTAVFCRAFKTHFNMNASTYREKMISELSNIHQPESNNGKSSDTSISYIRNMEQIKKWRLKMKQNIEVKEMPAMKLVYCRHTGAFDQIGNAYGKLMRWAGPRNLLNFPKTKTVTVYHDDPTVTKIENLRQSACITVEKEVKTEGEIGNLSLNKGKYVVGHYEIGVHEFENAWNDVCLWLSENGYQPSEDNPYELYYNDHEEHPEKKFLLDICIPVKTL